MEAEVMPLPTEDTTPPVININFVMLGFSQKIKGAIKPRMGHVASQKAKTPKIIG